MEDIYAFSTPMLCRSKFYTAAQEANETIQAYLLRLKTLAQTCEFGACFNNAVRDRFVMGMRDIETKNILLFTRDLTLDTAENIAVAREVVAGGNGASSNLEESGNTALMPSSPNDVYVAEYLSNSNHQGHLNTRAISNYNNSPAHRLNSHHSSMSGTQDADITIQNLSIQNNQSRLTMTPSPPPIASSPQDAPSTSYADPTERSLEVPIISPIKTPDGKNIYPCPHPGCHKPPYPNKSGLSAHLITHSSKKNFPCKHCKKLLKNQGSRSNHEGICKENPNTVKLINIKKEDGPE